MSPGAIIGRGGSNIKMVQSRSGARVTVNASTGCIEVSGSAAAVGEAAQMLQRQINAFKATGGAYPHPQQVHYLLQLCFGSSTAGRISFAACSDDVAHATGRTQQLYTIKPAATAAPAGSYGYSSQQDDITDLLSGLSMAARPVSNTIMLMSSQQQEMLDASVVAARRAVTHTPTFDEVKLRFNFGKNFFYRGPNSSTNWSIGQLQSKRVPDDMKSVFSNAVTARSVNSLWAWLQQQGFHQTDTKQTVSVHLNHRASNAGYTLSFINTGAGFGSLSLRKMKSGNTKLAFCTVLSGPDAPDCRYKLLAQYNLTTDADTMATLNSLASSAYQSPSTGSMTFSGLAAADMVNDKERHKDKEIYTGCFHDSSSGRGGNVSGTDIKVTISSVRDGLTGQTGYEVAGTSPALNGLLMQALQRGSVGSAEEQVLQEHLNNILAFAKAVVAYMASA